MPLPLSPNSGTAISHRNSCNLVVIRTFGAVMTTFTKTYMNCGQVRALSGPALPTEGEPVVPQEVTIILMAITAEDDAEWKGTEVRCRYHFLHINYWYPDLSTFSPCYCSQPVLLEPVFTTMKRRPGGSFPVALR